MKRALVLGGCGFVGRHFVRRLLDDGWNVVLVDDLSSGIHPDKWISWPAALRYNIIDFRHFINPRYNWAAENFDLIIHCAAVVGGRLKIDGDPLAVATDLAIDSDFFNFVVKAKSRPKVIYFSSSAVYPIELQTRRQNIALSESLVSQGASRFGRPDMSYGWSKLTGEYLAHLAVDRYNADVVVYRPFSGYGEDQSFDYPFPSIIRRVVERQNPIQIWGSGEQCRDFIHIDDIVGAVMETKDVLKPGEVLNLGSGIPTSFIGLMDRAVDVLGAPLTTAMRLDMTKPEGVFYRVADTYKLSQFYKPKISIEEGIRRVAKHLRESHA
jgi:nucleoside-diphosphate-sugar epimerase